MEEDKEISYDVKEEEGDEECDKDNDTKETVEAVLAREAKDRFRKSFELVFKSCPVEVGKSLSKKERRQNKLEDTSLRYAEITFDGFYNILQRLKVLNKDNSAGGTFCVRRKKKTDNMSITSQYTNSFFNTRI